MSVADARLARLLLALAPLASGCAGANPDQGLGAQLRLSGAQFVSGELRTQAIASAPTMQSLSIGNITIFPGATGRGVGGSANEASGVLIGLDGDSGHWIVPTGGPDPENMGALVFQSTMSFSPLLPLAPAERSLIFRAVDAQGTVGPPMSLGIKVAALGTSDAGAIPLEVTLEWDTEADLDLKLRVPNPDQPDKPIDVWNRSPVALPPVASGDPPHTADEIAAAGKLDFDSNAQCTIDGRLQENVVFPQQPPSGTYQVRVDAFSLCGQVAARWHALAQAGGQTLGEAYGQMSDLDSRGSHGPATGTLAFTFTVP
jgi:hypothetical protein